jgi:hypothetical protein
VAQPITATVMVFVRKEFADVTKALLELIAVKWPKEVVETSAVETGFVTNRLDNANAIPRGQETIAQLLNAQPKTPRSVLETESAKSKKQPKLRHVFALHHSLEVLVKMRFVLLT